MSGRTPSLTEFLHRVIAAFSRAVSFDEFSRETREAIRERLLAKIRAGRPETRFSDLLDERLQHSQNSQNTTPRGTLDWLAVIAAELRLLPKVSPRVAWRERVHAGFEVLSAPRRFALFLVRATSFAMACVIAFGVAFISFVSQTAPTYAEVGTLDITAGDVRIRTADATFFIAAKTGDIIREGDTLRVGNSAKATLALTDAGRVELAEKTEVAIKSQPTVAAAARQKIVEPTVSVAVLSGSVNAKMEDNGDTKTLSIETPSGTVAAPQSSEVAVAVDAAGTAEVTTHSDNVALTPLDGSLTKELPADSRAVLSATTLLVTDIGTPVEITSTKRVAVTKVAPPPDPLADMPTEVDIVKTRTFDALILIEEGNLTAATRAAVATDDALIALARRVDATFTGDAAAARAFLAKEIPSHISSAARVSFAADLDKIALLAGITREALAAPQQLRGVPEFAIVVRDRYAPSPELRKLFAALSLRNFASASLQNKADSVIATVVAGYQTALSGSDNRAWTEEIVAGMGSQPVYLPALREMRRTAPASVRYILDRKIAELEAVFTAYVGAGN